MKPSRVIAVDWSGARTGAARKIWWAERSADGLAELRDGRSREGVTGALVAAARAARDRQERVVIGLDFAFAMPAWFAQQSGWATAPALWRHFQPATVDRLLVAPVAPFWGRDPQRTRPAMLRDDATTPPLRATDREVAAVARPFSVFQVAGAGSVGTAALRGFATLHALHEAGAVVWPFRDDPGGVGAVVLELWPRLAAPRVTKADASARVAHVGAFAAALPPMLAWRDAVARSDDAFDALVAMHALWRARADLVQLPPARSATERLEGRIWVPPLSA
jgi:hypothetical protein